LQQVPNRRSDHPQAQEPFDDRYLHARLAHRGASITKALRCVGCGAAIEEQARFLVAALLGVTTRDMLRTGHEFSAHKANRTLGWLPDDSAS
jgi:hypothetical protein